MALKVDLRIFLDEQGNVLELTEQAQTVFNFLSKIVLSVSGKSTAQHTEPKFIDIGLTCKSRSEELSCIGGIEGVCLSTSIIKWQCDTCKAAGSISHWQGSLWDKQKRTIH